MFYEKEGSDELSREPGLAYSLSKHRLASLLSIIIEIYHANNFVALRTAVPKTVASLAATIQELLRQ
jgi:hypothetical protein